MVQLCLLGLALLTAVDLKDALGDLRKLVEPLVRLLESKNASIQANAVWVLANICSDQSLKIEIIAHGGATMLQSILSETLAEDGGASGGAIGTDSRPSSVVVASARRRRRSASTVAGLYLQGSYIATPK